jgi:UDP-GlcNAc3NAcA epimerase
VSDARARLVTVVGTRPQLIKAAAVSRVLARSEWLSEEILHTGQHYDAALSEAFFGELGLPPPARNLGVGSGPHGAQTGRMLEAIESCLLEARPALVLTYGDTNSTLAAALAAAKLAIPIAHVEAGVRCFDPTLPEEINRVVTDRLATLLLAPTQTAVTNLLREGVPRERVEQVGDPLLDVARLHLEAAAANDAALDSRGLVEGELVLATVHRQENTDDPPRLGAIFNGLVVASRTIRIVVPLHPRTRAALARCGLLDRVEAALVVTEPLPLLDMAKLERSARLIVTDSGGVQREAFFAGRPCVVLRAATEWPELVELGWSRLVPPQTAEQIAGAVRDGLAAPLPEDDGEQPLGDGRAAERIVAAVERFVRGSAAGGPVRSGGLAGKTRSQRRQRARRRT